MGTFFSETAWAPTQSEKNSDVSYLTNSKENFKNYQDLLRNHYPKHLSTGVTASWLKKSIESVELLDKAGTKNITTPILMFTAGDDSVVNSNQARKFCKNNLATCKNIHYKKGKHQLLIEVDEIRLDLYKKIRQFL